jgi:transposase
MTVLGIDTHKDTHAAIVLDGLGRIQVAESFGTTDRDNLRLIRWAQAHGPVTRAGVEGTGSYGYRLARALSDAGIPVIEVTRPNRALRRRKGKTDLVDAEAAARAVLAEDATAIPKDRRGPVGELRCLVIARRSAVKARSQATNQLKALLVDGDDQLRSRLQHPRTRELVARCSRIHPTDGRKTALRSLARRWQALNAEIHELDVLITAIVRDTAPALLEQRGVGVHCAAQLLLTAGDNPDRLRSEAAFAALCGVSPVAASSGKTNRNRLNLGGDRQANTALWMIAHVRLVHDERTRAYAAKRTAQGDDRREIMRRLKRYIAREIYPLIIDALVDVESRRLT